MRKDFVTVRKAAGRLDVSERTIRRLVERGELPAYFVGRQMRIWRQDLNAYLAAHRYQPPAKP